MNSDKVLVTGSNGFVGRSLSIQLSSFGLGVKCVIRSKDIVTDKVLLNNFSIERFEIQEIGSKTEWSNTLDSVQTIIHLAARTHVMNETERDVFKAYREVNVEGTKRLAEQAAEAGVKRFIFLSSVKVNGERTVGSNSFTSIDSTMPEDAYGISKWEAEQALWEISERTGLEVVIIRPPLVYGSGVKGNLLRLMSLIYKGYPIPLGLVSNQRSLIGLDNLVDLITKCIEHPKAAGKTLLASDGEDLSTPDLIRSLASAMGKSARLLPVPVQILRSLGVMTGKSDEVDRLVGSLRVDNSSTRELLDWTPRVSVEDGLRKMAEWYVETQSIRA